MEISGEILIWVFITLIGAVGFFALGYVQIRLANGKKYGGQDKHTKKIIACVSLGQLPCLVTAAFGLLQLAKVLI